MTKVDIDDLLIEDNKLEQILYPKKGQKIIKESPKGNYIFENNEQFKGQIKNNKFGKGIYLWPNGQKYLGDLSENNNFTKRGTIIFPSNNKLIGNFIVSENKIKNAVYETNYRKYQGTFVNNELDGKFIIRNKNPDDIEHHYFFQGTYVKGRKHGFCIIEKSVNKKILLIKGTFDKGEKNGKFQIYRKKDGNQEKLVYEQIFENNKIKYFFKDEEKIENKNIFFEEKLPFKIICLKTIKSLDNKIYILLGTYENILIIDLLKKGPHHPILIFKKQYINDILRTKDGKFLFCTNLNNFKLTEPFSLENEKEKEINESHMETNTTIGEINTIQEFKGLKNSKSIFVMKELINGLIASGDSENLILWKKKIENNFIEYNYLTHYKLTNTYCILEINLEKNNDNNKIILAVPQPDSLCVLFLCINNNKIEFIKKIENIKTIHDRKNIMKQVENILFIGCENHLVIINLDNFEIEKKIFFEKIYYINVFLNDYLLCGVIKNKNPYSFEGYLSQIKISITNKNKEKNEIIYVSKCLNSLNKKHNGSIIDGDIINLDGKEIIVTIGTDNKILVLG